MGAFGVGEETSQLCETVPSAVCDGRAENTFGSEGVDIVESEPKTMIVLLARGSSGRGFSLVTRSLLHPLRRHCCARVAVM